MVDVTNRRIQILAVALVLVAATAVMPAARQAALTADERALATFVDANNADALAMLERAVNINSGSMNFEGVRQVGALFRKEFDALGFKTEWIDGAAWNRAGHLVATHAGRAERFC
jgi:glutamate carboxypeptidase